MPFGFINAPYSFQKSMNFVLKDFIYKFCIVYIDDILIYSKTRQGPIRHIKMILERFKEVKLHLIRQKCQFFKTSVKFPGLIVGNGKIKIADEQLRLIDKLSFAMTKKETRSVFGFLGFFRSFMLCFSKYI